MPRSLLASALLALAALAAVQAAAPAPPASDRQGVAFFESKIRPVLVQHCYACHSADAAKAKKLRGGLYLDTRKGLREGGDSGPALVPGKGNDSLLVKAMRRETEQMPPAGRLPVSVVADFVKWIDMGAPDPRDGTASAKRVIDVAEGKKFWSFRPLAVGPAPAVKGTAWPRGEIDRFVLSSLEAKGISPAAPLSKEKLIRRATFDLTGLPPTPEEIDAFVSDPAPDAYGKLLDRLLASERHGERWGRHWLDVARFAESGGYEFDGDRPGAYHYRDFVVKALNQDMPFDEFVRLQLAGDETKPGDLFASSATGFLVAGPYPGQTTAKTVEPIRYDHLDDMVSTVGTGLLGLSLGCARCHEHKYDPIPQADYYRLIANLARTDSVNRPMDPDPATTKAARAAFDKAHAPILAAREKYEKEQLPARFVQWLAAHKPQRTPWATLEPTSATARGALKRLDDGSYLAVGKAEKTDTYTFVGRTSHKGVLSVRVEAMADGSLPKAGPGRGPDGNFCLTSVALSVAPANDAAKKAKPATPKLKAARATHEQAGHALAGAVDADAKTGWSVGGATGRGHAAVFAIEGAVGHDGGALLTLTLKFERDFAAGRVRVCIAPADGPLDGATSPQPAAEILALGAKLDGPKRAEIVGWFRKIDAATEEAFAAVERSAKNEPKVPQVPVFSATSGRGGDVYFLIRGETDKKNGVSKPGFVSVLQEGPEARWLPTDKSKLTVPPRVGLANWITDPKHGAGHLLARVIVNRLWQHHFGKGLVRTPNDFGAQGDAPTHPELLDHLAAKLIEGGWKLKPLHKLMMSSATYAQSGEADAAAVRADPKNLLWGRVPPRRLEAEAIRDAVLAVGGSLDAKPFGPGTLDENSPRRSVYLTVKRSRLSPTLQAFDAPEGIQSVGERQNTTATTQALAMMNSRFVRAQAEKLAARVRPSDDAGVPAAVEKAYRLALGRRPSEAESRRMTAFVRAAEGGAARGLEDACQVLTCANEFVYVD